MTKATQFRFALSLMLCAMSFYPTDAFGEEIVGGGKWQSLAGEDFIRGEWSLELERSGEQLRGTMRLTGSNVLHGGDVEGTIDGKNLVLGVASDGVTAASFAGKIDGDSIAGEWSCDRVKDQGVWYGVLGSPDGNGEPTR